MNQIIITIVYDPETQEVQSSVNKLGADKSISLRDLLLALNAVEGQYIQAIQISQLPEEKTIGEQATQA